MCDITLISSTVAMYALTALFLVGSGSFITAIPIVHAPWGMVKGYQNVADDWSSYHVFLGIPYALPPVGDRRFARPVPHPGFNHTFSATSFGPQCLQNGRLAMGDGVVGDEDCLTLNIFTPASHTEFSSLPVIVWIHGGGFEIGGALSYDASNLVARGNVITVTIQYRLGALGFLSTGDDEAKGNYGLWDQHLALQWIKRNIRAFGGDDNKITLMGQSAGAVSIAFHALYPGSKGLFHRTIMQSGSVTSSWAYNRNPVKTTMVLAKKLNCLPSGKPDHAAVVHCLRQSPANAIANAYWPLMADPIPASVDFGFVPTVDGDFIKREPMDMMKDQNYLKLMELQDLDCMLSVNSNEGGNFMILSQILDNIYNSTLSTSFLNIPFYKKNLIPGLLNLYFGESSPAMVQAVASANIPTSNHGNTVVPQVLFDTIADPEIVVPSIVFARAHAQLTNTTGSGKKTYMYVFDQSPTFLKRPEKGLVHGDDIYFTFGLNNAVFVLLNYSFPTQEERELSNSLMDFISGFARDGNPSPGVSFKLHEDWPEFTQSEEKYLRLDTRMAVASHPFSSRVTLWTKTLPQLLEDWKKQHTTKPPKPGVVG